MENEIKVEDWVRTKDGQIYKIEDGTEFYEDIVNVGIGIIPDVDGIWVDKEHFTYVDKRDIVKHSSNLIDLIQCGDYVNGYKVVETYKDKQLRGWQVGKSKEDETWLGVVVSSKMIKEPLQEYFDNEMIKTVATKEQFESISYKVKE